MDFSMDFHEGSGFLACAVTGKWVTEELKQYIASTFAELGKYGSKRLLADLSLVEGPPPEMDRFYMGEYIASTLRGIKVAVVYRKVYANTFFEDTAVNRGAHLKVFPDKDTALKWLMED